MMNAFLPLQSGDVTMQFSIITAYLVIALGIGYAAYRVSDNTAEDYFLASRGLGTLVMMFTLLATLMSAFMFFGGPNDVYNNGPEFLLVLAATDGLLFAVIWYLLGYRQWLIGKARGYITVGEMLGDRFNAKPLRAIVALFSIFWLFPYVMLQQMGAGSAISSLTNGAIPYWAGGAFITVFMIAYVLLSGMRGVAWTDTLQGIFMLVASWVGFAWVMVELGGPIAASEQVLTTNTEFFDFGGGTWSPGSILSYLVVLSFGAALYPQVNQRFFAAESKQVLKRSFILWPITVFLLIFPTFMIAVWGIGMDLNVESGANVLPIILNEVTPTWFASLVVAGAMAAMMSSSDSMLLTGSSYFTRDIYKPYINSEISERREALIGRLGILVFATLTYLASLLQPGTLVQIGVAAFSGFAQLTVPTLLAVYWQRTTKTAMYAAILSSQALYMGSAFLSQIPTTIGPFSTAFAGLVLGLVVTIGVSLVTSQAGEAPEIFFGSVNKETAVESD